MSHTIIIARHEKRSFRPIRLHQIQNPTRVDVRPIIKRKRHVPGDLTIVNSLGTVEYGANFRSPDAGCIGSGRDGICVAFGTEVELTVWRLAVFYVL